MLKHLFDYINICLILICKVLKIFVIFCYSAQWGCCGVLQRVLVNNMQYFIFVETL
ncbi:hypothetical protein HMPREF3208_00478 [Gardnerella vaginalis]|uniref:Uncharacterized protein n=1 Tax=Gardnerella vaginalis TaxID=2702 RepID=A0A133NZD2_GARVA|nr:hypothetical protein HMPREF3208_00478 [Gardnerella vaginalis]